MIRDLAKWLMVAFWFLMALWLVVRVIRLAWGETPAPALEPVTIHVRVERPEQVRPVVQSLLPALEDLRR